MVTMGQGCGCFTLSDPLALPGLARPVCPVAINYRPEARGYCLQPKCFFFKSSLQPSHSGGRAGILQGVTQGSVLFLHPSMPEITVTGAPPNPPETHAPATSCLTSGSTWAR